MHEKAPSTKYRNGVPIYNSVKARMSCCISDKRIFNTNSIFEVQASCYVPNTSLFYHKYNTRCVLNGLQTVPIPTELAALDLLSDTPDSSGFSMLPAVSFGKLTTLAFPMTSVIPHHLIIKICFLDPAGKSHAGIHYACASAIHCSLDILFPPDAHYNTLLELWQCIPNLVLKLWGTYVQEHS